MNARHLQKYSLTAALLLLAGALNVQAANVTKKNTTTMNGGLTDWSAAPATTDVGEFDATVSSANLTAMTLGASITLGGLQLDGTMNGPLTISAANTLTLGTSGINMTAANQNATLNCTVAPGGTQTWNVQSGRTLTVGSGITASGATTFSLTINNGNTGTVTLGNYTENFTSDGYLLALLGGNITFGNISTARTTSFTTAPTATAPINASSSGGIYVNGATVSATSITIGVGTKANSSSSLLVASGSLTSSGAVVVGKNIGSSRWNPCQVSGGAFTVNDTAVGLQLSPNNAVANFAEFYVSGGTATVGKISYGASGDVLGGTGWVIVKGTGNLYVGSGGIALVGGGSYSANCSLFSGLLGASADWSSSVPMILSGTAAAPFTIQAADATAVAKNITLTGVLSGSGALTKTGGGTLTLGGANTYAADTTVSAGLLKLGAAGVIPDGAGKGNLSVSGTLDLNTFSETINGLGGAGSVDNTAAGTPILTVGANNQTSSFSGTVGNTAGTLAVTKTGTGSASLTGANTYNGDTTVNGGALVLGSQPNSANFIVASGATLDVSTISGGFSLGAGKLLGGSGTVTGAVTIASSGFLRPGGAGTAGTLSISNSLTLSGTATNLFDLAAVNTEGAGVNDEVLVAGNVSLSENNFIIINLLGGSLANGTYKLFKYGGTLTGGTNNLTLIGFTSGTGQTAALDASIAGEIDIVVTAAGGSANLVWNGDGANNFWDYNTSSNFLNGVALSVFNTNDIVTFNDASTNQTVNLVGALIPQTVTVNSSSNYVFSGAGKLTSTASLTVTNTGTLTMLTTNDFSGSVNINGGTVQVGNGTTSGSLGLGTVANNSALVYNLPDDNTVPNNISGTGTLTKQSGNALTVGGVNTFSGNVLVQTGTVKLGSATALGSTAGSTTVSGGATLDLNGQTVGAESVTITGTGVGGNGALVNNSGSASHSGLVSLAADSTVGGSGNTTLSGTVGGGFNLTKAGAGTLTISGVNTNSGKTIITGGTLSVNADAKLGTAPVATVADQVTINGGTLATTATFTGAANRDITIGASGGTIDVLTGTIFTYADIIQGAGTLTKNGTGTMELTQNGSDHTYGGLILNAGTMAINKSSGLGAGTVLINGGTIKTDTTSARSPGNNVILNGGVTLGASGAGPLTFGGNWTITNASQTLTIDTTATAISGVIGQDIAGRALTKAGSGALTLMAANAFSGGITMNAGLLIVSNNGALGSGTITRTAGQVQLADGVVVNNTWQQGSTDTADSQMDVAAAGAVGTWTGSILCPNQDQFRCAGSGGTLVISNSTVSLGTSIFVVSRGTVNFAGNTVLTTSGSGLLGRPNAAGVACSITVRNAASISLGAGSNLGGGKPSGSLALTIQDIASMMVAANFDINGSTTGGAISTVNLNGGTLTVGTLIKSLASGVSTLNFNGGVLKASGNSASFLASLAGLTANISTGGGILDDGGFAVTVTQPLLHDAALGATPDGGLIKAGSGTLTLNGAETYTGNTTINAGTLALGASASIASTPVIAVAAGALLDVSGVAGGFTLGAAQTLSGFGSVVGTLTNNGTLAPGASIGTLTLSNSPVLNGAVLMELNRTNAQTSDLLNVTAPLALGGSLTVTNVGDALQLGDTFTLFSATSYSGSFSVITLPALAPTLAWNTSNLTNNGTIAVVLAGTPPVVASLTPLDPTAQCSSTVNFTVAATGTAPISYQWNTNGAPVSGETATNFSLVNVHFPTPITVSVTVSNGFGVVTSNSVVTIIDTVAPVVTVLGANPATNQCHSTYTDAGATALDACAGSVSVSSSSTVDANTPGSYTVTYLTDDGSGNTNTTTRTVVVIDTAAPVITYNFTNLNLSCGTVMPDVTGTNYILASDACSASLTLTQTPTNGASLALGTNEVILAVSDSSGNVAYSTNTVTVTDTTAPVITLLGANPATNECHVAYSDAGATALDGCSLTVNFSTNNSVNSNAPGSYTVTYTADDGNGNTNTATRTVAVIDTAAPIITLLGTSPVTNECHFSYTDAGATALDACVGSVSVASSSTVNANAPGSYTVTYTSDDGAGHTNTATRTVVVIDTLAPVITVLGANPATNECHVAYTDAGATATDACAGSVSVSSSSTVNANAPGTYAVTYTSDDGTGHTNTTTRTVVVIDTLAPTITVIGANPATNYANVPFVDPGATASDSCAGSLNVTTNGTVDITTPGTYMLAYVAADPSGNSVTNTRTVVVLALETPVITSQQMLGNGTFEVTFTGPDGQPYTLLSSPDLSVPQINWTTLTNSTFGPGATTYTDTTATNDTLRFYRVRSP